MSDELGIGAIYPAGMVLVFASEYGPVIFVLSADFDWHTPLEMHVYSFLCLTGIMTTRRLWLVEALSLNLSGING